MSTNRVLGAVALAMIGTVALVCIPTDNKAPVEVLIPLPVPVTIAIEDGPSIDQSEFDCMQTNIYLEAGNQSVKGMQAVALVTLNRTKTKHYPATVCGVVKEWKYNKRGRKVCQFSWYCDGKSDTPNLANVKEAKAWEAAGRVAKAAMTGGVKDFLGRATHYHANYVSPDWAAAEHSKRYRRLTQVGIHLFYRDVALKLKA